MWQVITTAALNFSQAMGLWRRQSCWKPIFGPLAMLILTWISDRWGGRSSARFVKGKRHPCIEHLTSVFYGMGMGPENSILVTLKYSTLKALCCTMKQGAWVRSKISSPYPMASPVKNSVMMNNPTISRLRTHSYQKMAITLLFTRCYHCCCTNLV